MIALNPDFDRLDRFAGAVHEGATMVAHPDLAERLNVAMEEYGLPYRVQSCRYLDDPETVYAIARCLP